MLPSGEAVFSEIRLLLICFDRNGYLKNNLHFELQMTSGAHVRVADALLIFRQKPALWTTGTGQKIAAERSQDSNPLPELVKMCFLRTPEVSFWLSLL